MSADGEVTQSATHDDIMREVRKIGDAVGHVGYDEYGVLIGHGLLVDVARLRIEVSTKVNWVNTLVKQASVAMAILGAAGLVIWYLIGPAVDSVVHGRTISASAAVSTK